MNAEPPILYLSQLENAPRKNGRKDRKGRKLFAPSEDENITENMLDILPSVLNKLNAAGHRADFCLLLRTINSDLFPLHSIALRLLFDVARWYSLDSTTQMTYSNDSLKFWKVVYKLFHGKVLRFLSGTNSVGQVVDGDTNKWTYDPRSADINFAVPSVSIINSFDVIESNSPKEMPSGLIPCTFLYVKHVTQV